MRFLLILASIGSLYFVSCTTPRVAPERIPHLMRYVVQLYIQYTIDPAAVRLNQLMDQPLLAQTYGIIDSIRGWASNAGEEEHHRDIALNFLRRGALYYILQYVEALIEGNYPENNLIRILPFEEVLLRQRIRIILVDWDWEAPENQIVRQELIRFRLFSINVSQREHFPYFRLSLRDPTPIRFNENILLNPNAATINYYPHYSRPIPHAPEVNRNNEMTILFRAQTLVLGWYREFVQTRMVEFEPYMNENSQTIMESILQAAVQQSNHHECSTYVGLMSIALLNQCLHFLFAEFNRYDCHPYHREHRHARFDARIRGNHATLLGISHRLTEHIENLVAIPRHNTFYEYVTRRVPFHIGYALNRRDVILLIALECDVNALVQNHYNYEE